MRSTTSARLGRCAAMNAAATSFAKTSRELDAENLELSERISKLMAQDQQANFAPRCDALVAAFPELTANLLEDIKAVRSSLERQGVPVTSKPVEKNEIPCFVPLGTRLSQAMAEAIGVDTTNAVDVRFEFGEPGVSFVVVRRFISDAEMALAIKAAQAIDPEAPL